MAWPLVKALFSSVLRLLGTKTPHGGGADLWVWTLSPELKKTSQRRKASVLPHEAGTPTSWNLRQSWSVQSGLLEGASELAQQHFRAAASRMSRSPPKKVLPQITFGAVRSATFFYYQRGGCRHRTLDMTLSERELPRRCETSENDLGGELLRTCVQYDITPRTAVSQCFSYAGALSSTKRTRAEVSGRLRTLCDRLQAFGLGLVIEESPGN